jgi:uncharacterized phage protein (TIGR01671 family)
MREILFRGQDTYTGKWHYGKLTELKERNGNIEAGYYLSNKVGMPFSHHVYGKTIGQYTGIIDKDGLMVFEGDIVSWKGHGIIDNGELQRAEICFDETELAFKADAGGGREWFLAEIQDDIEVIGNFYDTPELLGREGKEVTP